MTEPAPLATVRAVVLEHVRTRVALDDDTALVSGGLLDSVALLDVMISLEERCGVSFPPREVQPEDFDSIRKIAATIARFRPGATG